MDCVRMYVFVPLCTLSRTFVSIRSVALGWGVSCRLGTFLAHSRIPREYVDFAAAFVRERFRKPHRACVRIGHTAVVGLFALQAEFFCRLFPFFLALRDDYERHGRIVVATHSEFPFDSEHSKQQLLDYFVGQSLCEQFPL